MPGGLPGGVPGGRLVLHQYIMWSSGGLPGGRLVCEVVPVSPGAHFEVAQYIVDDTTRRLEGVEPPGGRRREREPILVMTP